MLPVRPARESDIAFIVDAWKRSYEGAAAVKACDHEHYRAEMARTIKKLVGRDGVNVVVAYDPADDDHLVGFACFSVHVSARASSRYEHAELHYVYVKKDFRGKGIARRMLEGVPIDSYTFLSPTARQRKGWRFTPRFTI